jgi:hypothetical protein
MTFEADFGEAYWESSRWTKAERAALRERLDSLVSRAVAGGHPSDPLKAAVEDAGGDLARQTGLCYELTEWLDGRGLGTIADRLWRAEAGA